MFLGDIFIILSKDDECLPTESEGKLSRQEELDDRIFSALGEGICTTGTNSDTR